MPKNLRARTRAVWTFALLLAGSRAAAQWSSVPGAAAGDPSAATFPWQGIERVFVASVDDGFGGPPAAADATRSRIPLEELERAYALFGESSSRTAGSRSPPSRQAVSA